MPDQQVLYVVTAIVVVGLVAWVAAVLTRRSKDGPPGQNEVPLAPVAAVEVAPALPLAPVQVLRKPKGSEPPPTSRRRSQWTSKKRKTSSLAPKL